MRSFIFQGCELQMLRLFHPYLQVFTSQSMYLSIHPPTIHSSAHSSIYSPIHPTIHHPIHSRIHHPPSTHHPSIIHPPPHLHISPPLSRLPVTHSSMLLPNIIMLISILILLSSAYYLMWLLFRSTRFQGHKIIWNMLWKEFGLKEKSKKNGMESSELGYRNL